MKKQKAMVFLLDGAGWKIVEKGILQGKLPTLKKFIDGGFSRTLRSVMPPTSFTAIPSIYTGKNPGKIGFRRMVKPDGSIVTSQDIKEPTIWEILSDHGFSSLVYNVIGTFPPKKFNGMMVAERLSSTSNKPFTYPAKLGEEYDFPFDIHYRKGFSHFSDEKLYNVQSEITKKRFDIFLSILKKNDFDFTFFVFKGLDFVQHFLWHRKDLLLEYYNIIDSYLKQILELDIAENLFIISDHGFEDFGTVKFYINSFLHRRGYLVPKHGKLLPKFYLKLFNVAEMMIPRDKLRNLFERFKNIKAKKNISGDNLISVPPGIDAKKSYAYSDIFWGINIGKTYLDTGKYETLREKIINDLKNLKYGEEPVIKEAYKREEQYNGPYKERFPDILFLCHPKFHPSIMYTDKLFRKFKDKKTGNHSGAREGILITYGEEIRKSKQKEPMNQLDIAPTILQLYDIRVPNDMDGKVISELFIESSKIFNKKETCKKAKESDDYSTYKHKIRDIVGNLDI